MPIKAKKKVNIRHKKILQKMVENGGKGMNMPQAMRDVGYSEAYIRSNKIKDTESWSGLVNEILSDRKLVDIHNLGAISKCILGNSILMPNSHLIWRIN